MQNERERQHRMMPPIYGTRNMNFSSSPSQSHDRSALSLSLREMFLQPDLNNLLLQGFHALPSSLFWNSISFPGKKLFLPLNVKHSYDFIPAFPFSLSTDVENRLFSFFCSSFSAHCDHAFPSVFISLMLEYISIASSHLP